ncbi:MAG: hypothetical protein ACP6IY_13240 [Promethearchaeia archaeon]
MVVNEKINIETAFDSYKKVREALKGIHEILYINFNENDFYYQAGMDNLKALHDNLVELLKSSFPPREVRKMLRELEFDEREMAENFPL